MANRIVEELDAGDVGRASDLFERVQDREEYRDRIYPVVYQAAEARYQRGDAETAARILTFMRAHYPEGNSVRAARLYSLFQQRGQAEEPPPEELLVEIEGALEDLRAGLSDPPAWADLVETQLLIDRGRTEEARASFARFLERWDGRPPGWETYVQSLSWKLSES